jgi:GT2 family glycosyltransferase
MDKLKFALIICTYNRRKSLLLLLDSVKKQSLYPDQLIIIDGSTNEDTAKSLKLGLFPKLKYFKVNSEDRGLTRQRNIGIAKVSENTDIVCFLDDDTVLKPSYFYYLIKTYLDYPSAIGVGGYILDEIKWRKSTSNNIDYDEFQYDGWVRKLGSRNKLRKKIGLLSNEAPGRMPEYSHGLSISFLPPSNKTYPVDFFMGGVASYKFSLFSRMKFSSYFEGYGLYEDMDFCLRASKQGQLYVNTSAALYHYHDVAGRPNKFNYGKMVIRNGWYVWRVKNSNPNFKSRAKWHGVTLLLILIRLSNILNSSKRTEAFTESLGRIIGWVSLFFSQPKQ